MISVAELARRAQQLPPLERMAAAQALEKKYGDRLREEDLTPFEFRDFVARANPRFIWHPHNEIVGRVLERVEAGEISRLIIVEPPRHGKSEQVCRLFPAWYLSRHPDRFVSISSYSADLAYDFSRAARRNLQSVSELAGDSTAVGHWETGRGGGLWATGVGGPATGKGFHVGIIDDPIKNNEEAASEVIRAKHRDWYESVFYTRQEPGAAIIVTMTRWHLDDLVGWLIEQEEGEEPEGWHIVHLPAIAEQEPPSYPKTCTVEPDPRKPGEALCPERYPIEKLKKIQGRLTAYFWNALFQGHPVPRSGSRFKWEWFEERVDAIPERADWVAYWDTAGTEGGGDFTAGALLGRDRESKLFYVADVVRGQWSPGRRDQEIAATCTRWRDMVGLSTVWLERESGVGGEERSRATVAALAEFTAKTERVTGSKEDRGEPFAAQAEVGNVRLVRGPWNQTFLSELVNFPHGKNDDQHDAVAGAYNKLTAELEGAGGAISSIGILGV